MGISLSCPAQVAPAADEAYCAARPAGCVGVAQRGVGACVDSSLANATGPLDALRALARPPPRVAISYGDVVVLYATHGKAQKATRNGRPPRRLGLALYAGVPLRTLKTLIPTRRLRVRPLDAARFDLLTGATFLFLLAAQHGRGLRGGPRRICSHRTDARRGAAAGFCAMAVRPT